MGKYTFRPAKESDKDMLVQVEKLAFTEEYSRNEVNPLVNQPERWVKGTEDLIMQAINGHNAGTYLTQVCVDNTTGEIIGFCYWQVDDAEHLYLKKVATHPDFRGKGIAKHFLNIAIQGCRANNKDITLSANEMNKGFYSKLGFEVTEGKSDRTIYMGRKLRDASKTAQDFKTAFDWFYNTTQTNL